MVRPGISNDCFHLTCLAVPISWFAHPSNAYLGLTKTNNSWLYGFAIICKHLCKELTNVIVCKATFNKCLHVKLMCVWSKKGAEKIRARTRANRTHVHPLVSLSTSLLCAAKFLMVVVGGITAMISFGFLLPPARISGSNQISLGSSVIAVTWVLSVFLLRWM